MPEQEKIVEEELNSGNYRTAEEVIADARQALREKERSMNPGASNGAPRAVREMEVLR
jgi:Arc/MetJ-type ribon-helix-helix transcriptional regulator